MKQSASIKVLIIENRRKKNVGLLKKPMRGTNIRSMNNQC